MPPTFPIAGLNRCTPKFQGGPKSQPGVIGLASSTLQSQPFRKVVHGFGVFGFRFSRPKGQLLPIACHAYSERYASRAHLV